ncbi:hypothetical protein NUU61_009006 [Penicillium alfredii]|uniref:PHD-type domain-containing protein n=1 Tax=Penicillium alfredii TaxID=1506179 RepID=A0A9W9EM98_9EURO|nr:uncharacterized protein NUU61_009006 [Penicillium alfredii]KAJ5084427.1 hypothetical protein NUU61_009006 [Penicillium alfredii]
MKVSSAFVDLPPPDINPEGPTELFEEDVIVKDIPLGMTEADEPGILFTNEDEEGRQSKRPKVHLSLSPLSRPSMGAQNQPQSQVEPVAQPDVLTTITSGAPEVMASSAIEPAVSASLIEKSVQAQTQSSAQSGTFTTTPDSLQLQTESGIQPGPVRTTQDQNELGSQPVAAPAPAPQTSEAATKGRKKAAPRKPAKTKGARSRAGNDEDVIKAGPDSETEEEEASAAPAESRTTRSGRVTNRPAAYGSVDAVANKEAAPTSKTSRKRKRVYRKKDANIVCARCQRGNSPSTNAIVFCDGCNAAWHQKCHDPPIDNEVIRVKEMEWYCHECKPTQKPADEQNRPLAKPRKTQKRSQFMHPRQKVPQLELGGDQFTADERRAYLSALSHASLVELLVNVSSRNPSVPMFPANMHELPASAFPAPMSQPANDAVPSTAPKIKLKKRSRTTAALEEDPAVENDPEADTRPRKRTRAVSAPVKPSAAKAAATKGKPKAKGRSRTAPVRQASEARSTADQSTSESTVTRTRDRSPTPFPSVAERAESEAAEREEEDEEYYVEDHRVYPRAGNGFCPPSDDLDILREDPDCSTFSHALHGPAKRGKVTKPTKVTKTTEKGTQRKRN